MQFVWSVNMIMGMKIKSSISQNQTIALACFVDPAITNKNVIASITLRSTLAARHIPRFVPSIQSHAAIDVG